MNAALLLYVAFLLFYKEPVKKKTMSTLTAVVLSLGMLGGCATNSARKNTRGENMGIGAAAGALGGAVLGQAIGGDAASTATGAALGAAVGAGAGYVVNENAKTPKKKAPKPVRRTN